MAKDREMSTHACALSGPGMLYLLPDAVTSDRHFSKSTANNALANTYTTKLHFKAS